jgi:glycosyltransferase involved in cell wall biosynthesis
MSLVSIIVPCFNQAKYLDDALNSVLNQSHRKWECIVVNDGSTDNTSDVVNKWTVADSRFVLFEQSNAGLSAARNAGLKLAKGKYIQFLDSDDCLFRDKLSSQVRSIGNATKYGVAITNYIRGMDGNINERDVKASYLPPVSSGGKLSIYELIADWETRISIPAHCFLFTRDFFDDGIEFNIALKNHEDWDCWVQIFSRVKKIVYDPSVQVVYRNVGSSMSKPIDDMKLGFLGAIDKNLQNSKFSSVIHALLRAKRGEILYLYEYRKIRLMLLQQQRRKLSALQNS